MWSLHRCHRVKGYSLDLGKNLLRNQVKSCENYLARDGKKSQGTQHGREHPATVPVQIISSTRKLLDWGYLRTPGIPQMLLPIWCGGKNGSMKEGRMGIQVHYWHYINYIRGVIRGDRHRRATECELAHLNSQISPCVLSKAFGYSGPLVWDLASKETSCQIFHDLGGNLIWSKSISQEISGDPNFMRSWSQPVRGQKLTRSLTKPPSPLEGPGTPLPSLLCPGEVGRDGTFQDWAQLPIFVVS